MVNTPLRSAWAFADEVLGILKPRGPRYLNVLVAGGAFPENPADPPIHQIGLSPEWPVISRAPLNPAVDDTVLASIERELRRATGEMVYEPEPKD